MIAFEEFPKIPRLNRSMVVTEKIDGSNAAIIIGEPGGGIGGRGRAEVAAQSRKRIVTPGKSTDLAGFAAWVQANRDDLIELLGPGRHFGEWYGQGIQRGYGLDHKRFALFNTDRWVPVFDGPSVSYPHFLGEHAIHTVPVLGRGDFSTGMIAGLMNELRDTGSRIPELPRYPFPAEGVVVWHNAARQMFKATLENDERPKGSQEPA